jgi:type II secretory pathway pseudopilin PulG
MVYISAVLEKHMHLIKSRVKGESGFNLIETIVGIAIVATAVLAITGGLVTATKAGNIHSDEITGEILARGQMEYVVRKPYSTSPWSYNLTSSQRISDEQPSWWDTSNPPLLADNYTGYLVSVDAVDFDADEDGVLEVPGDDSDIHRITVKVYRPENKLLVSLESNKANR